MPEIDFTYTYIQELRSWEFIGRLELKTGYVLSCSHRMSIQELNNLERVKGSTIDRIRGYVTAQLEKEYYKHTTSRKSVARKAIRTIGGQSILNRMTNDSNN